MDRTKSGRSDKGPLDLIDKVSMNELTGELEFTMLEDSAHEDTKPEEPDPSAVDESNPAGKKKFDVSDKELDNFDHGDRRRGYKRYKDLQTHTSKLQQEVARVTRKLQAMENRLSNVKVEEEKPSNKSVENPGMPDLESLFESPESFMKFLENTIQYNIQESLKSVDERFDVYKPMFAQYTVQQELLNAVTKYPDLLNYNSEMTEIIASLEEGEELSIEQLYNEAKSRHELEHSDDDEDTEDDTTQQAEESQPKKSTDTPDAGNAVTTEELKALVDATTTESGVAADSQPKGVKKPIKDHVADVVEELWNAD